MDENETTTTEVESAPITTEVENAPSTDASVSSAESAPSETTGPKSLAEALDAGIADSVRGRKPITPKAEGDEITEETAAAAESDERNPDGTFKKKVEPKPGEEAKKEEVEEDAVDAPIPSGTKERTAKRMQKLIDIVKEQRVLGQQHEQVFDAVRDTGASPNEFAAMLTYMKSVRSNDAASMESAYKLLQGELLGLAIKMGKSIPEVNLLTAETNNDLVQEIRSGQLTPQRAHEIALQRAAQERTTTERAAATQRTQQTSSAQADHAAGVDGLNALEDRLMKDANYRELSAGLIEDLREVMEEVNPRRWPEVFEKAYNARKARAAAAPPVVAAKPAVQTPKSQPLRPKAPPAGGGGTVVSSEPKSVMDAVNLALAGH